MENKPVVLVIMDGWGNRPAADDNAVTLANPQRFNALLAKYPHTELEASGEAVGLPEGQMGNSEVGHLNIGAGRVVYQEITRISQAIRTGEWKDNLPIRQAMQHALEHNSALHLLGLLSDGGVHSHMEHLFALLDTAKEYGLTKVFIHAFLDGRDVPPSSALNYIDQLEASLKKNGLGAISTLGGRYYGMDRDQHWDRVSLAYEAMVDGTGVPFTSARSAVEASYAAGITDEFMLPVTIVDSVGASIGTIQDDDSLIFFNFRADRARQISHAFTDQDFLQFPRTARNIAFLGMTQYDAKLKVAVAFPPQSMQNILTEVLSSYQLRQMRIAETEKYAHLTFFFNGQIETAFPGEDRTLIPSPSVATYDLQPQMSAASIASSAVEEIRQQVYDVILINFANPDMVGHTGVLGAAVEAVKTVDEYIGQLAAYVLEYDGVLMITADHGNCEKMFDEESNSPHTAHTTSKVPFVLVGSRYKHRKLRAGGALCDIAPTLLDILSIPKPPEMTGVSLLKLI